MISRDGSGKRLGPWARVGLALLAFGLMTTLGIARRLEPDVRGFGTHTQLGLRPCSFLASTGRPCPSCGMTTSFARFVRGNWSGAWQANPAGSLLAPLGLLMIPWLISGVVSGRPTPFRGWDAPIIGLSTAVVALTMISWLIRMTLG